MKLSDIFSQVAHKTLTRVDLPQFSSTQHEINGIQALRQFFGGPSRGLVQWHHFRDESEPRHDQGSYNFYDARAKGANRTGRTEWRLYYTGDFLSGCKAGDVLVLAKERSGAGLHALVFEPGSQWWTALRHYIGDPTVSKRRVSVLDRAVLEAAKLGLIQIVSELGLEPHLMPSGSIEDQVSELLATKKAKKLGFPSGADLASAARRDVIYEDPDQAVVAWLEREEVLFRACESRVMEARLRQGFENTDEFATAALSMLNRRKSRMGKALQNHLTEIFRRSRLHFDAEKRTEGHNRPDFLFPSASKYHDGSFDAGLLRMLAAKSTCKDRWRQILTEANRIPIKHLCTLEQAISRNQTQEMSAHRVQLVVPLPFAGHYRDAGVQSLADFVAEVRILQAAL